MPYPGEIFDDIAADGKNNALLIIEDEKIVFASPAYLKMMGFEDGDPVMSDNSDIRSHIHPDDKAHLDDVIRDALINRRSEAHYTFREKTRSGHYILREDYARYQYDDNGNLLRTYVICRDITDMPERKAYVDMLYQDIHVLIAEDNRMNMMLNSELIRHIFPNCVITEAWDGQQAVDAFSRNKPDLLFMDINMPNMDGYQASSEIRKLEGDNLPKVPIIAITAKLHIGERERCLEAGMNEYIPKPIDEKEFKKIVLRNVMPYLFKQYYQQP